MKTVILTLGLTSILASCIESDTDRLNRMKSPVVVKSKGDAGFGDYGVLLQGADGHVEYFSGTPFDTPKVGDTLK